jgi:KDO2-lipid IV(A) lauroyltransferase
MLALLRSPGRTRADVLARSRVAGFEAFREAFNRGRGAIIITGHLGNWEMAGAIVVASGIPLDVVVQRQHNPLFHRDIVAVRERLGMRVIERGGASGTVLDALRAGRAVALVADQNAGRNGVFVPFFGRLASTHRGPALLALRSGAPLFVGCALRAPDGLYDAMIEEVIVDRGGDPEAAVPRITAAYTARLEALVRRAPEQYFWVHKRWKTRPPEEQGRSREV